MSSTGRKGGGRCRDGRRGCIYGLVPVLWAFLLAGCYDDDPAVEGRTDGERVDGGEHPVEDGGHVGEDAPGPRSDAGPGEVVNVDVETLCADPEAYDGRRISIAGAPSWLYGLYTAVGCDCCNVGVSHMGYRCSDDPFTRDATTIVLLPGPEREWEEISGEAVLPELLDLREGLLQDHGTTFGCAGQECFESCTPALPHDLANVTGTFGVGQVEPPARGSGAPTYGRSISVESFETRVRYDGGAPPLWSEDDCPSLGLEEDRDPCVGDFVCPPDPSCDCGGKQAHCIDGTVYYERRCREYCEAEGADAGADGG